MGRFCKAIYKLYPYWIFHESILGENHQYERSKNNSVPLNVEIEQNKSAIYQWRTLQNCTIQIFQAI